ncbi:MAG: 4-hydroxy-tetrahydrodipicolinate synthase, partial [Oscillospiraceae bacterium]|nr:4-hydroxy-tetrahydrodipicolinate synthase [Oscillospiraceae bacterium]
NKTSQRGLIAHYTAIADAVNIPCILYNVPSRTGVNINVDTLKTLAKHKNIAAVKEASGNISQIAKVFAECGDLIDVYSGNDDQIVPIMSLGGKGVISVLSNVAPSQTHAITQACLDNNYPEAAALAAKYLSLANALFCDVNPIPVKEALNMMGIEAGPCRLPLYEMEDSKKDLLRKELVRAGLIK